MTEAEDVFIRVTQLNSQTNKTGTIGVTDEALPLSDASSENNQRFLPFELWLMHSLAPHKLPSTTFHQEVGDLITVNDLTVFLLLCSVVL